MNEICDKCILSFLMTELNPLMNLTAMNNQGNIGKIIFAYLYDDGSFTYGIFIYKVIFSSK